MYLRLLTLLNISFKATISDQLQLYPQICGACCQLTLRPSSFIFVTDIVMEEVPTTPTLAPPTRAPTHPNSVLTPPANTAVTFPLPPPPLPPPLSQATQPERDTRRSGSVGGGGTAAAGGSGGSGGGPLGLTKEVLSAHTQQEEQAFLDRFKDLSKLRVFDQTASSTAHCHTPAANPLSRGRGTDTHTHTDSVQKLSSYHTVCCIKTEEFIYLFYFLD